VNLATYLLVDAFRDDAQAFVVVSNDSDLTEPIRIVRHELGKVVGLLNPPAPTESHADALQAQLRQANPRRSSTNEPVPGRL
jgi:NYN domain